MPDEQFLSFPDGFIWGAATSSYQIEGGWDQDGKGSSIWDTFCRQPGKVADQNTGDVAADHYHRYPEDVKIMTEIGLKAYRFSISWPRIYPLGIGKVNHAGLDFYDRLVDALLEQGIQPFPTLYHWDLPQALQDRGGWTNRDTTEHFENYASVVAKRLGDRIVNWITHNEPWVTALMGHLFGAHAPGMQDPVATGHAIHHLLLSHAYAVDAIRRHSQGKARVGITLNLSSMHPATDADEDQAAAIRYDGLGNRLFLDPVFHGKYPEDLMALLAPILPEVKPGDMEAISTPLDFLGVNYYTRQVVRHDPAFPFFEAAIVHPEGYEYSQMWEIYPAGIYELLARIQKDYQPAQIFITENGTAVPDGLDFDGRVRDPRRIRYIRDHLAQVHRAISEGVPVGGYFVWSLLDNFEWALGYRMRFGMVYVDFKTLKRTIKDSGRWYSGLTRQNGFDPKAGVPC